MDTAAKRATHGIGTDKSALNAGFQEGAVVDIDELFRASAHPSIADRGKARDKLQHAVGRAKLKLANAQSRLADKARQTTEKTERYVVIHPWKSVALVTSIGVVVGLLMGRRP